jgi:MSHA biogenesis protein MshN
MSVVNSALSKISEQTNATPKTIEKAEIPTVKRGISPVVWVGIGVLVSLAVGGWAITAGDSSSDDEKIANTQPKETQTVMVEVEPLVINTAPQIEQSLDTDAGNEGLNATEQKAKIQQIPTQKTDLDTEIVTVYAHDDQASNLEAPVAEKAAVKPAPSNPKPTVKTVKAAPATAPVVQPKPVTPPPKPAPVAKAPTPKPKPVPKPVLVAKATPIVQTESMTIEQVELTPQELAKQAIARANKAVEANDAQTAISEYTKALRFVPTDENTRQRLAALYYGKREARKAVDLLQQGIQINQEGEPLRMALAKLLLKEKQTEAALSPVAYLPTGASTEYLSLRAGIAQQIKNVDIAKQSYAILAEREPQNGRWWLGLAIQQERDLEFELAMASYQSALGKVGVSNSSQEFIRQRIALLASMQGDDNGN